MIEGGDHCVYVVNYHSHYGNYEFGLSGYSLT